MTAHIQSKQLHREPYRLYSHLRTEKSFDTVDGLLPTIKWSHSVTRYHDVAALLRDPRMGSDVTIAGSRINWKTAAWVPKVFRSLMNSMIISDAPDHTRLRKLVSKAFTPRMIQGLETKIETITNDLLDDMDGKGTVDLIKAFALPLPLSVISEMIGMPPDYQRPFHQHSVAFIEQFPNSYVNMARQLPNLWGLQRLFERLIQEKRQNPADDLTSALIAVEDDGDRLSDDELVGMLFLLLVAGHETTVNLIGNGVLALLEHPEQLQLFQENPAVVGTMIEEMLRYTNPVQHVAPRFAKETVEINGNVIKKGESVVLFVAAANRDEAIFSNPNQFDITRTPNKHLGFGFGAHYCLGAPLARLEAKVAFQLLFERYPNLKLAVPTADLKWREAVAVRGLTGLPLHLG